MLLLFGTKNHYLYYIAGAFGLTGLKSRKKSSATATIVSPSAQSNVFTFPQKDSEERSTPKGTNFYKSPNF